jgi:hypothetical protein
MKLLRLIQVLERIACALEALAPQKPSFHSPNLKYPPLGITQADNETTAAYEAKEDEEKKSRGEKLMSEYAEYVEWRERNVTKGRTE